ncbi:MAG: NUDIX hydrolase [Phycisphaerales bacterium]|jgi:ADP-ribose pyrophosphatase
MPEYNLNKLTDCKWINLYSADYADKNGSVSNWTLVSRKEQPITDAAQPDAVVIVPVLDTPQGRRLVVTKEFRVPIWDYEYGFAAGLIEKGQTVEQAVEKELKEETGLDLAGIVHISSPVYSSAGMTDESCCMVIVEAKGQISDEFLEGSEQIEAILMDVDDIQDLLESGRKISAKAWGLLYYCVAAGSVDLLTRE